MGIPVNTDRVTIISLGFFLLFIAFNSAQNYSAQAMKDAGFDDLGFYSLASLYLVFSFCSFLSTGLVNFLGVKKSLIFGSLGYFFWILCFIVPSLYRQHKDSGIFLFNRGFINFLVIFSAGVTGLGASILWVA